VVAALCVVKLWRTLLFAVVAVGLGAYIWLVEKPRMDAEARPDKLVQVEPDRVARVRLAYPDSPAITLERRDKKWRIVDPLEVAADDTAVDRLVQQLADAKAERRIATKDAESLATYGLEGDGKRAKVTIGLDDGTELPSIIIGDTTPVGYDAFARVDGHDEIIVIPLIVHTGVKKTVFDLRDKKLFDVEPDQATALTLGRAAGNVVLARQGDQWAITSPIKTPADSEQIRTLLRSFDDMTALAYFGADEIDRAKFGLDAPTLEVQADFADKGAVGFRIGAKTTDSPPGYYVERVPDGQVAKIAEWALNRFDQDVNALRDKRLFHCEASDIAKVSFERAEGVSFALEKQASGRWAMEPPPPRALKDAVVERSLSGLASLSGKEVVTEEADTASKLAAYGLDVPTAQVEASKTDGSSCGRAIAGVVGEDSDHPAYYVKRVDAGTVMSVPSYLYSRLDMKPDDFLEPVPQSTGAAEAPPAGPAPGAGPDAPSPSAAPAAMPPAR
jgi:Domain of unknown function (DUF4340)